MQNGPDFDRLVEPFIQIYQNIEHDLIVHIATHFKLYEDIGFKNSMEWYAKKVEELGGLTQEAIDIISKETKIPKSKIVNMLKDASISTIDLEAIDKLNDSRDFKIDVNKLKSSESFLNIIENSYKDINGIFKLINTKAIESSNQAYMNILNQAYTEARSGIDYNSAIRKALTKMAKQGIRVATYKQKNGKVISYGIESCVRRDVLTAVVQCTNRASENFAKEMKAEYYEVSQHLGARDTGTHDYKDHSWWQGSIFKIDGSTKEYPNFQETCNEGDVQGIGGANCRHIKWAFWPDISIPKKVTISKEENKRINELLKAQRDYEIKIRDYKRNIDVSEASNDSEKFELYKSKLKDIDEEYNQFCKDNNLRRKYAREDILHSNNSKNNVNSYEDATKKWLEAATPNSHKLKDMNYFEHDGKKYFVDGNNVVLDYSRQEKEVAEWLEDTFGGEIYMVPRINKPDNISTPDYIWKNEKWDLKEIIGDSNRAIDNAIKRKKEQSNNFIIDITKNKLSEDLLIKQVEKIYSTSGREWIDKIILKKEKEIVVIYKRK